MLSALHYDLSSLRLPEFGELPIICLASSVPTLRPPDDVIADAVEISGQNAFEEVVDVETVANIQDPFKEQLIEPHQNPRGLARLTTLTGWAGSLCCPSTVDDDVGAGNKTGGVGTQEHGQRSNFLQFSPTA